MPGRASRLPARTHHELEAKRYRNSKKRGGGCKLFDPLILGAVSDVSRLGSGAVGDFSQLGLGAVSDVSADNRLKGSFAQRAIIKG